MIDQWLEHLAEYPAWVQGLILGIATLGSEDLTTITAGILVAEHTIHPLTAVLGCFFGIFIGDGLLYVVGYVVGRPALKLPILRNMMTEEQVDKCARWFEENGMIVIIASRFLPGTRLPTYFAAGLVGSGARYFLLASAIAVAIWTPLLVGVSWLFGEELMQMLEAHEQYKWPVMGLSILLMFVLVRLMLKLGDWRMRARIRSRLRRFTRWEFYPLWLTYAPVVIFNLLLALRYRRLSPMLVSNPGIEYSGFVGESKQKIMEMLVDQPAFVAQFFNLEPTGSLETRKKKVQQWMVRFDLSYPIIMKPDVGQRGDGVARIKTDAELLHYLETCDVHVQVQEYLPGPYEFGISYCRYPWEEKGRVVGLTGKEFPRAVGDGEHTLYELILRNPLCMGRVHIFRERFKERLDEVLAIGEVVELVRAGNHCLGTLFNDGSYLLTPQLAARVDEISRSIKGFYIGRYDVRASDLEAFRSGECFKIMELNGASAEPSFIYDTRHSLYYAYKMLFAHFADLWRIGMHNASNGHPPPSIWVLIKQMARYRDLAQGQADVK